MNDPERPVTRETTIIKTGERRGGGGLVAALVALVIVALAVFLFFGGYLRHAANKADINVNVAVPKIQLPDINIDTHPNQSGNQPATNQSGK
jgi:hypothetical protein